MREALKRAKHDLALLGSCIHTDPAAPDETFQVDVSNTVAWIIRALDGLDPLTIEPQQTRPDLKRSVSSGVFAAVAPAARSPCAQRRVRLGISVASCRPNAVELMRLSGLQDGSEVQFTRGKTMLRSG